MEGDNNKKQNKQKTKNKHSLKDCIGQFFIFFIQNYYDKTIPFDAALLVQKTQCRRVTPNEVLNNYGISISPSVSTIFERIIWVKEL